MPILPLLARVRRLPRRPAAWFATAVLTLGLALNPLVAAVPTVTGTYENEGSVVEGADGYAGSVSLAALFGLEFDYARGSIQYGEIARVNLEQRDATFTVRTTKTDGRPAWSGEWKRNGGYEPTEAGVKILLRAPRFGDDFFMYTFSPMKDGAILLVEVQRIQATNLGPIGKPVGKFLFLRSPTGTP